MAGGWWWYRRRQRATAVPLCSGRPPLALAALERLQRQDAIRQERIEEFYVRVSTILRRYVELRFGLRAPEQTTEEFLVSVLATGGLIAAHRDLLEAFLRQCDLVKFAAIVQCPAIWRRPSRAPKFSWNTRLTCRSWSRCHSQERRPMRLASPYALLLLLFVPFLLYLRQQQRYCCGRCVIPRSPT